MKFFNNKYSLVYFISAIIIGFSLYLITESFNIASLVFTIVGFVGLGINIALRFKDIVNYFKMRKTVRGFNISIGILLTLAILVMIYIIFSNIILRYDLSAEKVFALSDTTLKILDSVNQPVNIYVFEARERVNKYIRNLLSEYEIRNGNISVYYLDRQDISDARLYNKYKVDEKIGNEKYKLYNRYKDIRIFRMPMIAICFESQTERYFVFDYQLFDQGMFGDEYYYKGEEIFTKALKKVLSIQKKVYFTKGFGENGIKENTALGYTILNSYLNDSQYKTAELDLSKTNEIPKDCGVLVIASPTQDYSDKALSAVKDFLNSGGKVLMLYDRVRLDGTPINSNIKDILKEWGIRNIDTVLFGTFERKYLQLTKDGLKPITVKETNNYIVPRYIGKMLEGDKGESDKIDSLMYLPTAVKKIMEDAKVNEKFDISEFMESGKNAVGFKEGIPAIAKIDIKKINTEDLKPTDIGLAIISKARAGNGALIVFADSDFVRNDLLKNSGMGESNLRLFLKAIKVLAETEKLKIKPKTIKPRRLKFIDDKIVQGWRKELEAKSNKELLSLADKYGIPVFGNTTRTDVINEIIKKRRVQAQGKHKNFITVFSMILLPLVVVIFGIITWIRRKEYAK